jgi:hypothetical protein
MRRIVLRGLLLAAVTGLALVAWWTVRRAWASTAWSARSGVDTASSSSRPGSPGSVLDENRQRCPRADRRSLQAGSVAAEGHRFRHHPGLDPIATARCCGTCVYSLARAGAAHDSRAQLARTLFFEPTDRRLQGEGGDPRVLPELC